MIKEIKRLADIASRGGRIPPLYLYFVFILPGFAYSIVSTNQLHFVPFVLVAIAILPLVAATNLFDDFFDWRKGYDRIDSPNTKYRRHPVFYYKVGMKYLLKWAVIFSVIYFVMIFLISIKYGILLNAIAAIGFFLAYGYTGPPVGYKYLGLGEVGVFLSSLAASILVSVAILGRFDSSSVLFFIPFSLLIALILFFGNYRDREFDKESGFRTLAVLLGERSSQLFTALVFTIFYVTLFVLTVLRVFNRYAIIDLITAPLAYYFSMRWKEKDSLKFEQYVGPYVFGVLFLLTILSIFSSLS